MVDMGPQLDKAHIQVAKLVGNPAARSVGNLAARSVGNTAATLVGNPAATLVDTLLFDRTEAAYKAAPMDHHVSHPF